MFIDSFELKTKVQKILVDLRSILDFPIMHPAREFQKVALKESVEYIRKHMPNAIALESAREVLNEGLSDVQVPGNFCEFGVYKGGSIKYIAKKIGDRHLVHGFDSFEGLPERWSGGAMNTTKGAFSMEGKLPKVPPNVKLYKGWFDVTLPQWLSDNPDPIAFLHIDCDLYSSTKTIFSLLKPRIQPGTIIVFDEYFNYPNWQNHEFRAFQEFVSEHGVKYDYIAYARIQVAVKILEIF
jgi:Macrocin-O-methyltransferase (TylF)